MSAAVSTSPQPPPTSHLPVTDHHHDRTSSMDDSTDTPTSDPNSGPESMSTSSASAALNSSGDSAADLMMDFDEEEDQQGAAAGGGPGASSDSISQEPPPPTQREQHPPPGTSGAEQADNICNTDDNTESATSASNNPSIQQPSTTESESSSGPSGHTSSTSVPPSSLQSIPPPLSRSASLQSPPSSSTTSTSHSLVRSNSASAALPPPPLPPPPSSSTINNIKTEPQSPTPTRSSSTSTSSSLTLPVIRNHQQQQQQLQNHTPSTNAPPAAPGTPTTSTPSPVPAPPASNASLTNSAPPPSMLSTVSGPTERSHHASPLPPPHSHPPPPNPHLMDTYGHHQGPLGPLGPGGGGGHGGHQPQQTILSMSPSIGGHAMSNVSVVTVASSSPASEPKDCIEEACPVCGDRVSGYHYGLLTCESCKGFFKRTVQNKKVYTCVAERNCHIDKSQRKRCPYCRFQKCLEVGMKLEAVRADRMRGGRNKFGPMYKRDRARRLQIMRQKQLTKVHHMGHGPHGGHGLGHHPPGATMLPGGELNFLGGGHGHPGHHTTTIFDGVKQELIQIPQLSSSTSSPDSSPSPGSTGHPGSQLGPGGGGPLSAAAAAAAAAAAVAAGGQIGGQGGGAHHGAGGPGGHSFMPQLSISTHPMGGGGAGANNQSGNSNNLMNPTAAAAAAAADHLLKSWANGGGTSGTAGNGHLPGSSKSSLSQYSHDGGGSGSSSSNTMAPGNKYMPVLVREFQSSMIDDKEWQAQLFGLLQNQTYNQCEVDLFELMCKVIDQSLFSQVDWARNSIFFKELKVDDQMKLLQHAWSDMLVLDHIHQRMHVGLPDESTLPNGQKFDLLSLALLGVPQCADMLHRVTARLGELKVDANDYICLKFLLLLNPDVRGLTNYKLVHEAHEQTKQALLEYTVNFYPQIGDKFQQLLALVPEIRALTLRGEDFLYYKHMNGSAPTQTLLMEMLHAKKK